MPRARILPLPILTLSALLTLSAPSPSAFAEDELNGAVDALPPPPEQQPPPAETGSTGEPVGAVEEGEPPPRVVPLPKPDPRFNVDDHVRFRRWLNSLCRQGPVDAPIAERVRYSFGKPREFDRPENKTGSLYLTLKNYAELTQFRDDCQAARRKDPKACTVDGHLPRPWLVKPRSKKADPWLKFGSNSFWSNILLSRTPAGITQRTDLLRASEAEVTQLEESLKKNYFEVRDIADLGGRQGSARAASKLAGLVFNESTCSTRMIAEHDEPVRAPASEAEHQK
jgi:hypothetical protein